MVIKKYKYILLNFILVVLLLSLGQYALALEVDYPQLSFSGKPYGVLPGTDFIGYIQYVFVFLIIVAGIIGVISIVISGLRILVTAGSPTSQADARERIFGAILGIVLLMTSFIILRTINPDLVKEVELPDTLREGSLWYRWFDPNNSNYTDGYVYVQAPQAEANTNAIPTPYDKFGQPLGVELFYYCSDPANAKKLLVSTYNMTQFKIDRDANGRAIVTTRELGCNEDSGINIKSPVLSFRSAYKEPGVYFYLEPNCQGVSSGVQRVSGNIRPFDYQPNVRQQALSMKIVTGDDLRTIYGAILNKSPSFGGECSKPYFPYPNLLRNQEKCFDINNAGGGVIGGAAGGAAAAAGNAAVNPVGIMGDPGYPFFKNAKSISIVNFDIFPNLRPSNDGVILYSKDYMATINQSGNPVEYANISQFWITEHPDPLLLPPGQALEGPESRWAIVRAWNRLFEPRNDEAWRGGIGVRNTPIPYSNRHEEKYANFGAGGSSWFDTFFDAALEFTGESGPKQCMDPKRECIRSISQSGLYYTILYYFNPTNNVMDRVCKVHRGEKINLIVDDYLQTSNSRILEAIAIIPTTP